MAGARRPEDAFLLACDPYEPVSVTAGHGLRISTARRMAALGYIVLTEGPEAQWQARLTAAGRQARQRAVAHRRREVARTAAERQAAADGGWWAPPQDGRPDEGRR